MAGFSNQCAVDHIAGAGFKKKDQHAGYCPTFPFILAEQIPRRAVCRETRDAVSANFFGEMCRILA
jgi:hypothetical protein